MIPCWLIHITIRRNNEHRNNIENRISSFHMNIKWKGTDFRLNSAKTLVKHFQLKNVHWNLCVYFQFHSLNLISVNSLLIFIHKFSQSKILWFNEFPFYMFSIGLLVYS